MTTATSLQWVGKRRWTLSIWHVTSVARTFVNSVVTADSDGDSMKPYRIATLSTTLPTFCTNFIYQIKPIKWFISYGSNKCWIDWYTKNTIIQTSDKKAKTTLLVWTKLRYTIWNVKVAKTSVLVQKYYIYLCDTVWCFQCFDAVGWAAGRASGL